MNRITKTTAPATASRIGRLAEKNLTNLAIAAMQELARADRVGEDTEPLLTIGLALLRARQSVRAGIHAVELERWGAKR